jgi:hypothetical protein
LAYEPRLLARPFKRACNQCIDQRIHSFDLSDVRINDVERIDPPAANELGKLHGPEPNQLMGLRHGDQV